MEFIRRRLFHTPSMSDFPTLTTPRLHLREIVPADAPALFAIHSDVAAMRWFGTDPMLTLQDAEKLVEIFAAGRKLSNTGTRWGITDRASGQLLGTCGLFKWNRNWHSCALGYELAQSAWGQGLMQEALEGVLDWGFEHMALNRVEAQVAPQNTASIKRLQALGFVCEGLLRQAGFWLGEHRDLLQYALLRGERPASMYNAPSVQTIT
jgi:ribosomal-protein-alanine N-acetyltransferase